MQIAVADMAERHGPAIWQRLLHGSEPFGHEGGDLAHRDGNVVLDRRTFALLGLGMVLAQSPEGAALGLVLGDGGVEHEALFHRFAEVGLHLLPETGLVIAVAAGAGR